MDNLSAQKDSLSLVPIAYIKNDFPTKFGIARQSGLMPSLISEIIFEPDFRDENALRGIEGYSHLWLIWGFSKNPPQDKFSPMVKPPKLGGNLRMGVFATRSPNRPNPLGLSSVELISVKKTKNNGCVLTVGGADLADGTPIYDIKPYIAYTDSHPEAKSGFAEAAREVELEVVFAEGLRFPEELQGSSEKLSALIEALKQDPRPAYIKDPEMPYGFSYAGYDVRFKVRDGVLTVFEISKDTPHVK